MIASAQFTIISLCDVVTSDTPPENPYEGQLWVDTSVTPPETKIWDGNEWVVQNDIETIRTTISILTEKDAQFQQTIDGLNSYVATLTETVETVSNDQGVLEERVLNSESRVSELEHTVNGLSVTMQEQYIGGINYVQNSSGLNGITDDWSYSGTVKTDASTDTQNNTISDSCFVLGAYSSLSQYIRECNRKHLDHRSWYVCLFEILHCMVGLRHQRHFLYRHGYLRLKLLYLYERSERQRHEVAD